MKIHESINESPFELTHLDGSIHYFSNVQDMSCYNSLLWDFKPWLRCRNKLLYRTKQGWIIKVRQISSVVKFKNLFPALKELFYITKILQCR